MRRHILAYSTLTILLLSFLAYQPDFIGSYYRLESGELVSLYDESQVGALYLYDVNGDGNVNDRDRRSLQLTLEGWEEHGARTDIDHDGSTTPADLNLLTAYLERKHSASLQGLADVCIPGEIRCTSSRITSVSGSHTIKRNQQTTYISCEYDPVHHIYAWGSTTTSCPASSVCASTTYTEQVSDKKEAITLHDACIPYQGFPLSRQPHS